MLSRKTRIGLPPSCPEEPAEGPCAPPHRDRAAARPDRLGPAPGRPGDPAKTIRAPFACALSAAPAAPACATGRHADLDDVFAHQEERPLMADPEEAHRRAVRGRARLRPGLHHGPGGPPQVRIARAGRGRRRAHRRQRPSVHLHRRPVHRSEAHRRAAGEDRRVDRRDARLRRRPTSGAGGQRQAARPPAPGAGPHPGHRNGGRPGFDGRGATGPAEPRRRSQEKIACSRPIDSGP